ncbi:Uncharacterized protein TCM_037307 [Theobroma cacao]|uniref:Uncharacterized protein n=1 Tax=Theobroma cacao TaxID=3641 RepID=A0A061GS09_THECC|nr:Uncharacterized protein TCM_037307 [Theobroma cacao]
MQFPLLNSSHMADTIFTTINGAPLRGLLPLSPPPCPSHSEFTMVGPSSHKPKQNQSKAAPCPHPHHRRSMLPIHVSHSHSLYLWAPPQSLSSMEAHSLHA